ncbi:hypothetical protein D3C81_1499080 [compost metagenome]
MQRITQRKRMEAVQHQPQRGMPGALHDVPRLPPAAHMAAPGQCLVAQAQAPAGRHIGQRVQVGGGARGIVERRVLHVAADQRQRHAELLHRIELPLGTRQFGGGKAARHGLEIPQRLVEQDLQAEVGGHAPHVGGRAGELQQVVLEDLHAVETGAGSGLQLLRQRSRQGDGGNRFAQRGRKEGHGGQAR